MTNNAHSDFATMKSLFDFSSKVSINAWLALTDCLEAVELSKGSELQASGGAIQYVHFITAGVAQEFVSIPGGKNIVRAFHQGPAVVGNVSDYKRQRVSQHNVVMIQAGSAMRLACDEFVELLRRYSDLESWFLINMSQVLLRNQSRLQSLLQLDNHQRLEVFFREQPALANTLSAQQISEYLNVPAVIVTIMRKGHLKASSKNEAALLSA